MLDRTINAGVSAQSGFALQRNTALYLLLENYEHKFKNSDYFICLEHHDDFLFCFLNQNNEAEIIEAYQSKKKSSGNWTLNQELYDIITKLLNTGKALLADSFPKSSTYEHDLFFTTNQTIELKVKVKKTSMISESIKEDNTHVSFPTLNGAIKNKITTGVNNSILSEELDRLHFIWVDLNRTVDKQENELVGQLSRLFGDKIANHKAAVSTIISLFREIEETYNCGKTAKLLDESKRVSSQQIKETFHILTSQSKCFDYWRARENEVSAILQIKPFERESFKLDFITAFDLFKDLKEAEHRKILEFVKTHHDQCATFSEEENVSELMDLFKKEETTFFEDKKLKAILFAAYFEVLLNSPV